MREQAPHFDSSESRYDRDRVPSSRLRLARPRSRAGVAARAGVADPASCTVVLLAVVVAVVLGYVRASCDVESGGREWEFLGWCCGHRCSREGGCQDGDPNACLDGIVSGPCAPGYAYNHTGDAFYCDECLEDAVQISAGDSPDGLVCRTDACETAVVRVCEHEDGEGTCCSLPPGRYGNGCGGTDHINDVLTTKPCPPNDAISFIAVSAGCEAVVYEHCPFCGGDSWTLGPGTYNSGAATFRDNDVSDLVVTCEDDAPGLAGSLYRPPDDFRSARMLACGTSECSDSNTMPGGGDYDDSLADPCTYTVTAIRICAESYCCRLPEGDYDTECRHVVKDPCPPADEIVEIEVPDGCSATLLDHPFYSCAGMRWDDCRAEGAFDLVGPGAYYPDAQRVDYMQVRCEGTPGFDPGAFQGADDVCPEINHMHCESQVSHGGVEDLLPLLVTAGALFYLFVFCAFAACCISRQWHFRNGPFPVPAALVTGFERTLRLSKTVRGKHGSSHTMTKSCQVGAALTVALVDPAQAQMAQWDPKSTGPAPPVARGSEGTATAEGPDVHARSGGRTYTTTVTTTTPAGIADVRSLRAGIDTGVADVAQVRRAFADAFKPMCGCIPGGDDAAASAGVGPAGGTGAGAAASAGTGDGIELTGPVTPGSAATVPTAWIVGIQRSGLFRSSYSYQLLGDAMRRMNGCSCMRVCVCGVSNRTARKAACWTGIISFELWAVTLVAMVFVDDSMDTGIVAGLVATAIAGAVIGPFVGMHFVGGCPGCTGRACTGEQARLPWRRVLSLSTAPFAAPPAQVDPNKPALLAAVRRVTQLIDARHAELARLPEAARPVSEGATQDARLLCPGDWITVEHDTPALVVTVPGFDEDVARYHMALTAANAAQAPAPGAEPWRARPALAGLYNTASAAAAAKNLMELLVMKYSDGSRHRAMAMPAKFTPNAATTS